MCLLLMIAGVGCARSNPYVPPDLAASEVATLKGIGTTFVHDIDGREVKQGYTIAFIGSGNQTTAAPGRHRVGVMKQLGSGSANYMTVLDLAKGTTYSFDANYANRLRIKNENTGRTWSFDAQTLSVFDPEGRPHPAESPIAP